MTDTESERRENRAFRASLADGKVVLEDGIAGRPDIAAILEKVRLADPDQGSDPFGRGSFGSFEHAGELFCWEISRQLSLEEGDFSCILTVRLASGY